MSKMLKIGRRTFLKTTGAIGLGMGLSLPKSSAVGKDSMNLVIITSDDNDAESLGCYGCPLPDVTPHLDKLAREGLRFEHAHTAAPTCQSSRLSLMTGRYPQTNGNTGHSDPLNSGIPTLSSALRKAGYYTAIIGKQDHYLPEASFLWTRSRNDRGELLTPDLWHDVSDGYWSLQRSPKGFYHGTKFLVSEANKSNKPFFLHLNTQDPHRPWPGSIDEMYYLDLYSKRWEKKTLPMRPYSKNFSPWEVPIPGYLPDLPGVRVDVAQYYSALHNADRAVGKILAALEHANVLNRTIIIYLADQGASLPTSKQNLYRHSTRIPLIIKWPGVTEKGKIISDTLVSSIDIMATLLEGLGVGRWNRYSNRWDQLFSFIER